MAAQAVFANVECGVDPVFISEAAFLNDLIVGQVVVFNEAHPIDVRKIEANFRAGFGEELHEPREQEIPGDPPNDRWPYFKRAMGGFIAVLIIGLNGSDIGWEYCLHDVTYLELIEYIKTAEIYVSPV